jgi:hypothetical protein
MVCRQLGAASRIQAALRAGRIVIMIGEGKKLL